MRLSTTVLPGVLVVLALGCRTAARAARAAPERAVSAGVLPGAVAAVCDTVAGLWRTGGQGDVRTTDTTAHVVSESELIRGCSVMAAAPAGVDSAHWDRQYWKHGDRRGWTEVIEYAADGPDGNSRTFERGHTRCQVDYSQDGGDDSDSTYVPSPAVGQVTLCWLKT